MGRAGYDRIQRKLREKNLRKAIKAGKVRKVSKEELVKRMEEAKDKVNFVER